MNAIASLLNSPAAPTMSSQDIADLAGKRHDNVMRDIRAVLVELHGEGGILRFEDTLTHPQNKQSYPIFRLPKRETLILVAGYSVPLRAKIIDRWDELEAAQREADKPTAIDPMKALSDPSILRALLYGYSEKVLALESTVQAQAPKVQALERLQGAEGSLCVMDAAKALKVKPRALFAYLQAQRWIFKRPGCAHWLGYQDKVQAGLVEHKADTVRREDGTEKLVEQVRVTSKGMARLAAMLNTAAQEAA